MLVLGFFYLLVVDTGRRILGSDFLVEVDLDCMCVCVYWVELYWGAILATSLQIKSGLSVGWR